MKKKVGIVLASILVVLIVASYLFLGKFVYDNMTQLSNPKTTSENTQKILKEWGFDIEAFKKQYNYTPIDIPSSHGKHLIKAIHVSPDGNKERKTVVMIHGLGGTKEAYLQVGQIFLDLGYNILAYDQANSGQATAKVNAMGVLESYDALDAIKAVDEKNGENPIVLWGCSYGGLTSAIALGRDDSRVDAAILDSPMSDGNYGIDVSLESVEKESKLPAFLMKSSAGLYYRFLNKVKYEDMDATKWISQSKVPLLIIHSRKDTVTPFYMAEDLQKASGGPSEIAEVKATHGQAFHEYPEEYKDHLQKFLEKNILQ